MEKEKIREAYYEGYEDACDLIGEEGVSADTWKRREKAWDTSDAKKNLQQKDPADYSNCKKDCFVSRLDCPENCPDFELK